MKKTNENLKLNREKVNSCNIANAPTIKFTEFKYKQQQQKSFKIQKKIKKIQKKISLIEVF